jgi:hypothetical protein
MQPNRSNHNSVYRNNSLRDVRTGIWQKPYLCAQWRSNGKILKVSYQMLILHIHIIHAYPIQALTSSLHKLNLQYSSVPKPLHWGTKWTQTNNSGKKIYNCKHQEVDYYLILFGHSSGRFSPASHSGAQGLILSRIMWDMWWTKWHWSRLFQSTSVSHANSHSTNYSIIMNHPIIDAI